MGRKLTYPDHPLQIWLIKNKFDKYEFAKKLAITRKYLGMIIACRILPGLHLCFKIKEETSGYITPDVLKETFDRFQDAA